MRLLINPNYRTGLMYDLRILLVWLVLGFLLYLITIQPDKSESEIDENPDQKKREKFTGSDLSKPEKKSDGFVIRRLRSLAFVEQFDLSKFELSSRPVGLLPGEIILDLEVIPLKVENDILILAMIDPFDLHAIETVRKLTGYKINPQSIAQSEFRKIIEETSVSN